MEKKQLLLITNNTRLSSITNQEASQFYDVTSVKNIHVGYTLALSHLPDVIVIDQDSLERKALTNLKNFKSTHFLNKSFLFLLINPEDKESLGKKEESLVDGLLNTHTPWNRIIEEIEKTINMKKCLTNYWKDSFMGLFNMLGNPVVLLQDEKIVAMNDAFKKDFFYSRSTQVRLTDLVKEKHKPRVKETLRKFLKGKHMRATTITPLLMNGKLREAKVTFSKLDKSLRGQLVMMINFTGKECPINETVGSSSGEQNFEETYKKEQEEKMFTKREKEVITLLCKGYKTKEISEALCISPKTIEKHRSNIIKRTHSGTIVESIVFALNHNMIET